MKNFFSQNISYIENLYSLWREDPAALEPDWQDFFSSLADQQEDIPSVPATSLRDQTSEGSSALFREKQAAVQSLIDRFRESGHFLADVDPLSPPPDSHPGLDLGIFGLGEDDLQKTFNPRQFPRKEASLQEIRTILEETYCRSIGVEYMHIQDEKERNWLQERIETSRNQSEFSKKEKIGILRKLKEAVLFEKFLHQKFLGQKRFSLEGGEVVIPFLDALVQEAGQGGVREIVLGMAHRGRLNVLANIFGKPLEEIFAEFRDNIELGIIGEGDVKYHKGFSSDMATHSGHKVHLTMASNPSHLECVAPVVEGKTRAKQDFIGPGSGRQVIPVVLHGDAAFAGQGIVAETLNLSQLEGYRTGGTLHVILNNQIGFTTLSKDARSTPHATDLAKMLMVPIFHINGEDPEAAVHVCRLALEYRQKFGRDVIVDIVCFRRHGHNEGDEPAFTQPLMYEKIRQRPLVDDLYAQRLVADGITEKQSHFLTEQISTTLEKAFKNEQVQLDIAFRGKWKYVERDYRPLEIRTGVPGERLERYAQKLAQLPAGFAPHPKIRKLLSARKKAILQDQDIDWATAETLAFAALLHDGFPIRLSGQDSRRGTFSQRHAALYDVKDGSSYLPLSSVEARGSHFQVYDSILSEAAVLGFEYGYSIETPHGLTIWEAQFGDFANGAQVIIDQFLASSQTKWNQLSNLVLFLPHGFEGQGGEHSSARIERFLQLCADENIQVAYPSTPAQLFHLLRRQMKQPFRRPLIVFTPKSLLRHPLCRSRREELENSRFQEILVDDFAQEKTRTVLFCSGKIFYELLEKKTELQRHETAIVRFEQFYPLRSDLLEFELRKMAAVDNFFWVQEEPRNMGGWSFMRPHLEDLLKQKVVYIGRPEAASPATGSHRIHRREQEQLVEAAFSL
ncbi:MAG: 2-oxoglutarate dehydrogenase E1 component [Deltaproteobacteria bacterium]|nr:2-oxoglutarate dehydrogenase E1 component [Deltaproteobacteria bacterium]